MPRIAIDYTNTIIYKIQHNDNDELIYVGHTTDFTKRKSAHKTNTNSMNGKAYNRQVYKMIRDNGNWDSFRMIEIKKYPCADRREAEAEEDKVMRELKATMNTNRAYRTQQDTIDDSKEYRETHADEIKAQKAEYRATHFDEIKAKRSEYRVTHADEIKDKARIYRENLNKDENGNLTFKAYLAKLEKQRIYRDAYKERQKKKQEQEST